LQDLILNKKDNGVFASLKDIDYFKKFKLNSNAIGWNNGADISPLKLFFVDKEYRKKNPKQLSNPVIC